MPSDLVDKWRDEDGVPAPADEDTDWWLELPPREEWIQITSSFRDELYAKIAELKKRVADLEAQLAGK